MLPQLFLIAASFGATEAFDSLILWVETTPQEVRLGDPVFVRISARNTGKEPIVIPARFPQEIGGLCRFELVDNRERTRFAFSPDGGGSGGVSKTTLAPDDVAIVLYDVLALPRPDWFDRRFWMPKEWRSDSYELAARLRLGKRVYYETFGSKIHIDRRPENEIAALREFYNGGIHAPSPPGWTWDRPTLGLFGAIGLPCVGSLPDELAAIEQELSAGSLRDAVHGTRLTARLYDAKKLDERREAADELVQWLDARHEIARHWMAMQLVYWASNNRGLGEYRFEFVDRLIPRGPEQYGGRNWQDQYRQQNDSRRRSYLEYLQRPQAPPADGFGCPGAPGNRGPASGVSASGCPAKWPRAKWSRHSANWARSNTSRSSAPRRLTMHSPGYQCFAIFAISRCATRASRTPRSSTSANCRNSSGWNLATATTKAREYKATV